MKRPVRYALYVTALVTAAVAAWQIVATRASDWLAPTDPVGALAWQAGNPRALLALARQQLQAGHPREAAASARELLRASPLQADGLGIIAQAASARDDQPDARRLFMLALHRAPRDQYVRAWTIGDELQHGRYEAALDNVNVLFGFAPAREADLVPVLIRLADHNHAFAATLGHYISLSSEPGWRNAVKDELLAHGSLDTLDRVFSAIEAGRHGLNDSEASRWYARLEDAGRWGEAYSRWVSRTGLHGDILPLVFDGNFERPASNAGFGWIMRGEAGVNVERVRDHAAPGGLSAEVTFLGRRTADIGFSQTMLLAAGDYRLTFRTKAEGLRSDKGLEWEVRCAGDGRAIGASPRLAGSFDWKTVSANLTVPDTRCPAQWMGLTNPGAGGAGKITSGRVWFGDFRVTPVRQYPDGADVAHAATSSSTPTGTRDPTAREGKGTR